MQYFSDTSVGYIQREKLCFKDYANSVSCGSVYNLHGTNSLSVRDLCSHMTNNFQQPWKLSVKVTVLLVY
jgi:hypothetical protein